MAPFSKLKKDPEATRSQDSPLLGEKNKGAGYIKKRFDEGLKALRMEQFDYWTNHAFLLGEQWLYTDQVRNTIDQLPRDEDRVRITVNRIWPASRTIISKLVSRPLQFNVPPAAADDATIRAAHLSESVLASLSKEHDWEGLREDALWAVWKGGTVGLCIDWDKEAGQPVGADPFGRQLGVGDTVERALSVTDFVFQPGVRDAERAQWWIKNEALPCEVVQDMFDMSAAPKADASAATTPYQSKMITGGTQLSENVANLTRVLTYYERPSKMNPKGKVCAVVADEVVAESDWPFPFKDRLNLVIMRETRVLGRATGETVVKIARPVQAALNQSWSSIVEHMKLAGNARLMVPQSSVDMMEQLTDLPGEIVPFPDNVNPPTYMSPPQMPAWWIEQPKVLGEELDDILGVHDVSRGQAPQNIQSGFGLSILVEQDTTPVGRLTKESSIAFAKFATLILEIYAQNATETRKAVVKSPSAGTAPETVQWIGKDLLGQVNAIVPLESIMPKSRAQQQAFAEKAMEMKLITNLEQFVKLSDLPDGTDILEALSPDVSKARRENYQMSTGQAIIPATFDDHVLHNAEHRTFMKSVRWDTLDQQSQEIFLEHIQGHATLSAEQLGNQAAKMAQSPLLASAAQVDESPVLPPQMVASAMPAGAPPAPSPDAVPDMGAPPAEGPLDAGPPLPPQ